MAQGHFFISYSHEDSALVDQLRRDLEAHGATVWIDHERLTPGTLDWEASVRKGIGEAQAVIYAASPAAVGSRYVKSELGLAEADNIRIIPFWILGDAWPKVVPLGWGMTQHIDARGAKYPGALGELAKTVGLGVSAAPRSDPTPGAMSATAGPFSRVVDWRQGMGDHTTIPAALAAAQPGERILVRRGVYEGSLTIDKPLELIGEGQPGDVEVRASGANVLKFSASQGRVANLTLRQTGGGDWYAVDIAAGRLALEDCDISSQSLACVAIHDGANPILRRNLIHDGKSGGVFVYKQGQGLLEDNDIFANAKAGVAISEGGAPTLRRNRIHENKQGVFVYEQGQGLLEDTDIFANANAGVEITTGGAPTLRRNRIHKNGYEAIWVYEQGGGVFEGNDLRDNTRGAWDIDKESAAKVTRRGNQE